ncbi:MAG: glycosyltransferase [Clostridium sp.]
MNNRLVSVIMSTYNEPESWIDESVQSILNQTYSNIEFVIVCDNPKNEKLISQLNNYKDSDKRIKLIINETNIGLSQSLNRAIKACTGDFIARMDSDDIAFLDRIESQLSYLNENNLDLVGAGVVCIDENGKEVSVLNSFPQDNNAVRKKVVHNNCIVHPTWFGKSIIFKELDGYREVPYAEDYDFVLRTLSKGYALGNIKKILLKYRIRSSSISNKNGLKQFLVSRVLSNMYKDNQINRDIEIVTENINNAFKSINESDEKNYYDASQQFTFAALKLQKFNPMGAVPLLKACFGSKYYKKKIVCYIRGIL